MPRYSIKRALYVGKRRVRLYRQRIWFYPLIFAAFAGVLFSTTIALDSVVVPSTVTFERTFVSALLFAGSSDAARSVLSGIAGAWTTIAGVVYSITIVALQLAGSKFTSQLIPRFERDLITQLTLGSYTGVVAYSLLVLKTVRAPDTPGGAFVPVVGVNIALLWAITALILTILFIANLAKQIQPISLVEGIRADGINSVGGLSGSLDHDWLLPVNPEQVQQHPEGREFLVRAPDRGYVQEIAWDHLFRAIRDTLGHLPDAQYPRIEVQRTTNAQVDRGEVLGRVVLDGEQKIGEDLAAWLGAVYQITDRRDVKGNPNYAVEDLSNTAIKATQSGDIDVVTQCLTGLADFYAAASHQVIPTVLEIRAAQSRALVSRPDPDLSGNILAGIDRIYRQAVAKQYGAVVDAFFQRTGGAINRFVQDHCHALENLEGARELPQPGRAGERADQLAYALKRLLPELLDLYTLTAQQYADLKDLARVTNYWINPTIAAVQQRSPLAVPLIDFLRLCHASGRERPALENAFRNAGASLAHAAPDRAVPAVQSAVTAYQQAVGGPSRPQ